MAVVYIAFCYFFLKLNLDITHTKFSIERHYHTVVMKYTIMH